MKTSLKNKLIGYYTLLITGKCNTYLYFTGCGCDDCMTQMKEEANELNIDLESFRNNKFK